MYMLQLPNKTTETIDKLFRKVWWVDQVDKKKIHTIKWSVICRPINEGGLGIRDSKSNNLVLLVKICLRYLTYSNLHCSKIFKEKYYPNKVLWEAKFRKGISDFGRVL